MSVNLLELAKGYFTNEIVEKASSFLGENPSSTESGINHILPTLMGGLIHRGENKSGAQELFNMVTRPEFGGGLLSNIGDLFDGTQASNDTMNLGGSLLRTILGERLGSVADIISSASGMKSGSTSSLMKLTLPILMSILGKKIRTDGLGLDGFSSLLSDQKEYVEKEAPDGLLDKLLGVFGVSSFGAAAATEANPAKAKVAETAKVHQPAKPRTVSQKNNNNKKQGSGLGRILPLLLVLGLIVLAYFLYQGCDKDKLEDDNDQTTNTLKGDENDAVEGAKNLGNDIYSFLGGERPSGDYDAETGRYIYDSGEEVTIDLPNSESITVGKFSGENTLYQLITNDAFKVEDDKSKGWFTLDGVFFETGSANLDNSSNNRLENVATILKAYPDVSLKFGGYTDNEGGQEVNQPLSESRAKAAMDKVTSLGVDASRLAAEGYGQEHPICPANDTDACKAMNRRVDVRITKK